MKYQFFISIFLYLLACSKFIQAFVTILRPYHPLYVQAGSTLELQCTNNERKRISWSRQQPVNGWKEIDIIPQFNNSFVVRYTIEEPSGFQEIVLKKRNVNLLDRGTYICKDFDNQNSFSIWVTVLVISTMNITSTQGNPLVLKCILTGFTSNIPTIDYDWLYGDKYIPASLKHYEIKNRDNIMELQIAKPTRNDGGVYSCMFTLYTNLGPLSFSKNIYVDSGSLVNRASLVTQAPALGSVLNLVVLFLFLSNLF